MALRSFHFASILAILAIAASLPGCATQPLTGPADAGADAAIQCRSGTATAFPDFDRSCATTADCMIGFHQVDCCGTVAAIGMAEREQDHFDGAERTCRSQFPACGCAVGPTRADDGRTSPPGGPIVVECVMGSCRTRVS